jgi:hemerythrin-like domain-containing protein
MRYRSRCGLRFPSPSSDHWQTRGFRPLHRIEHFLDVLVMVHAQTGGGSLTALQRKQLEGAIRYFSTAAPRHTADEEQSLFPKLRASHDPAAGAVLEILDRLEHDHDDADVRHREVDRLGRAWLDHGTLPASDADALHDHLQALKALYDVHIRIEDRELFPAAGRVLTPGELEAIGQEMAARRSHQPLKLK